MRRLELDYHPRKARFAAYVLAATAIAFATDVGVRYQTAKIDIKAKQARMARIAHQPPEPARLKPPPASAEEQAFARHTVRRLAMPWEQLFDALEAAANERVALLAIEPDAESRTVNLSGEAKDYLAALSYVASLGEQKALARVYLLRHELKQDGSSRPVGFMVSASWGSGR